SQMNCPACNLINPDSAQRCDCGYDFETRTIRGSYLPQKLQKQTASLAKKCLVGVIAIIALTVLVGLIGGPEADERLGYIMGEFLIPVAVFTVFQSACRWLYLRWRYPGSSPQWEWPTRWPLP